MHVSLLEPTVTHRERLCRRGDIVGKLVSKEVIVGNQMRVAGESLTLSSARREYGLVAGDQSAARLARVIIGHVGGDVHTETVARELVVHSLNLRDRSGGWPFARRFESYFT